MDQATPAPRATDTKSATAKPAPAGGGAASGSSRAVQLRGMPLADQVSALDPAQQSGYDAQAAGLAPSETSAPVQRDAANTTTPAATTSSETTTTAATTSAAGTTTTEGTTTPAATTTPGVGPLSVKQLTKAKDSYARGAAQWPAERVQMVAKAIGLGGQASIDEAFIQGVASWQQRQKIGVDGIIGPEALKRLFGDAASGDAHERAKAVTKYFESGNLGYAAYQNLDKGIVSYGVHQCTLAAGSLGKVIDGYIAKAKAKDPMSPNAKGLEGYRATYKSQSLEVKEGLRGDGTFKQLLVDAAAEPEMVAAQEEVFESEYWKPAVGVAVSCGLSSSLGLAAVYDCAIQSGTGGAKSIADKTIAALGGIVGSTGKSGAAITEKDFIVGFNQAREGQLDAIIKKNQAEGTTSSLKNAEMLENSKVRGRMFTTLAEQGNLGLAGDAEGNLALPVGDKSRVVKVPAGDGGSAVVALPEGDAPALTGQPAGASEQGTTSSKPATGATPTTTTTTTTPTTTTTGGSGGAGLSGAGKGESTSPTPKTAADEKAVDPATSAAVDGVTKGIAGAGQALSGAAESQTLATTPQVSGTTASGYQGIGVFKVTLDQPFRAKDGKAKTGTVKAGQKVQVVAGAAANQYAKIISVSGEPKIVAADEVWIGLKYLAVDNDAATNPGTGKTGAGVQLPAALAAKLPAGRQPGKSAAKMVFKAGVSFFDEDCAIAPDTMGRIMRLVQWAIAEDMVNTDIVIKDAARSRKRAHTYTVAYRLQTAKDETTMGNILKRAKAVNGAENVADKDGNQWWLKDWGLDPNADETTARAKIVERSLQIRKQSAKAAEGYKSSEFPEHRWPNAPGDGISQHCSGKAVDLDIPWKGPDGGTNLWAWEEILAFFGLARTVSTESWHVEPKGAGQLGVDPGKAG